jgi:hypothetical protein
LADPRIAKLLGKTTQITITQDDLVGLITRNKKLALLEDYLDVELEAADIEIVEASGDYLVLDVRYWPVETEGEA